MVAALGRESHSHSLVQLIRWQAQQIGRSCSTAQKKTSTIMTSEKQVPFGRERSLASCCTIPYSARNSSPSMADLLVWKQKVSLEANCRLRLGLIQRWNIVLCTGERGKEAGAIQGALGTYKSTA